MAQGNYVRVGDTLTNIINSYTGEWETFNKVTTWADGTPMNDSKTDGVIYRKLITTEFGAEYFANTEFLSSGRVNVKQFGAKGDGITDDTAAAVKTQLYKNVYYPPGRYKITKQLTYGVNTSLSGAGENVTVLDFSSGIASDFNQTFIGILGEDPILVGSLTVQPKPGDSTLTIAASSYKRDDVLMLLNPVDFSYSKYRAYYKEGEVVDVKNDSTGGVIELKSPIVGERYGTVTNLYRVPKCTGSVSDMTILCNNSILKPGLSLENCTSGSITNVTSSNSKYCAVALQNVYNVDLNNVSGYMDNPLGIPAENLHYGLVIGNCQNVSVNTSKFSGTRHATTTGGGSTFNIVNRYIYMNSCELQSSIGLAAYDHHGNSEYCGISNSVIKGGVTYGGRKIHVIGCSIFKDAQGNYSAVVFGEPLDLSLKLSDNTLTFYGDLIANRGAFVNGDIPDSCEMEGTLDINNNEFRATRVISVNSSMGINISTNFTDIENKCNVSIVDNKWHVQLNQEVVPDYIAVRIRNVGTRNVKSVNIHNNGIKRGSCRIDNVDLIDYSFNNVEECRGAAFYTIGSNEVTAIGNKLKNTNLVNVSSVLNAPIVIFNARKALVTSNILTGSGLTSQRHPVSIIALTDKSSILEYNNNMSSGFLLDLGLNADLVNIGGNVPLTSNPESLYFAKAGTVVSFGSSVYIKTTLITLNTGWKKINTTSGTTVNRPVLTNTAQDIGFVYNDTTLQKPITWWGSSWKDATGIAV